MVSLLKVNIIDRGKKPIKNAVVLLLYKSGVKCEDRITGEDGLSCFFVTGSYVLSVRHPDFDPIEHPVEIAETDGVLVHPVEIVMDCRTIPPDPEEPPTIDFENLTTTLNPLMNPIILSPWIIVGDQRCRTVYKNKDHKLEAIQTACYPIEKIEIQPTPPPETTKKEKEKSDNGVTN